MRQEEPVFSKSDAASMGLLGAGCAMLTKAVGGCLGLLIITAICAIVFYVAGS